MPARGLGKKYGGAKWIRREKRLAIYLRDGLACTYCGASIENGAQLTLDHIVPRTNGGDNDATNLVTACTRCNFSRGARRANEFAHAVAQYLNHEITGDDIIDHIQETRWRPLDIKAAKALIEKRGYAAALQAQAT